MSFDTEAWPKIREQGNDIFDMANELDLAIAKFIRLVRKHSDIPEPELAVLGGQSNANYQQIVRKVRRYLDEIDPMTDPADIRHRRELARAKRTRERE